MKAACADGRRDNRAEDAGTGRCDASAGEPAEDGTLSAVFCWSGNEEVELPPNAVLYDDFGKLRSEAETDVAGRFAHTRLSNDTEEEPCFAAARVYNLSVGRWMQQDPAGFAGGDANLYRFAACDVRGTFLDDDGTLRDA